MKPGSDSGTSNLRRLGMVMAGVGVALFVSVLYLKTLAPTVLYYDRPDMFDSVMLQTEVSVLGIGHPTGYPTYMMLTHLFTYLPFGDVAYRINLASAVYGVAAVVMVYLIGLRLSRRPVAAAVGALALGTGETFWSQAVITEVYTLDVLFVSLAVFLLLVWRDSGRDRYFLLAAFLAGLSLTHHLTSALLVPAGLAFAYLANNKREMPKKRLLLKSAGCFSLGLLPYLYLPIRAFMNAPLNESDPSNLWRFLLLITGGSYVLVPLQKNIQYIASVLEFEDFSSRMLLYGEHLFGQFPVVLVLAGFLGLFHLLSTDRAVVALLGTLFVGSLLHVLLYLELGVEDYYVFFIPAQLILCLWISVGVGVMLRSVEDMRVRFSAPKVAFLVVLSVLALATPLVGLEETYRSQDRSQDYKGRRIIEAVAQNVEQGATVLHHRSSLWYMVLVEGRRQDLKLIDPFYTSFVRYNNIVWPDPLSLVETDLSYDTHDQTGIGTAREAAKKGHVYVLDPEFDQNKADRFREAGFDVVPVEDKILYELIPLW